MLSTIMLISFLVSRIVCGMPYFLIDCAIGHQKGVKFLLKFIQIAVLNIGSCLKFTLYHIGAYFNWAALSFHPSSDLIGPIVNKNNIFY